MHALAGWKDFLNHCLPFPVHVPVAATTGNAAGMLTNGIAILHQVNADGRAE